jgi:hypothetical protein
MRIERYQVWSMSVEIVRLGDDDLKAEGKGLRTCLQDWRCGRANVRARFDGLGGLNRFPWWV